MRIKENRYLIYDYPQIFDFKYLIKRVIYPFVNLFYKLYMGIFYPRNAHKKKYEVSICAIFKDEGQYLKEWLEFHILVGVEHFYLYNNNSTDNYLEILQPYIDRHLVTLLDWPKKQSQMEAYYNCYYNYKDESHWIGFIDLDEYVIPNDYDDINDFLSIFNNRRPVVIIYWKYMGSSGKIHREKNGLVTEDFVLGWNKYANIGKIFFNTDYEYLYQYKKNEYMHLMWAKLGTHFLPPINIFGNICWRNVHSVPTNRMPIQINHYLVKTYNEYVEKKSKRGGGVHDVSMHNYEYFFKHDMKCQTTDYHAYKYLIKLKLALKIED